MALKITYRYRTQQHLLNESHRMGVGTNQQHSQRYVLHLHCNLAPSIRQAHPIALSYPAHLILHLLESNHM